MESVVEALANAHRITPGSRLYIYIKRKRGEREEEGAKERGYRRTNGFEAKFIGQQCGFINKRICARAVTTRRPGESIAEFRYRMTFDYYLYTAIVIRKCNYNNVTRRPWVSNTGGLSYEATAGRTGVNIRTPDPFRTRDRDFFLPFQGKRRLNFTFKNLTGGRSLAAAKNPDSPEFENPDYTIRRLYLNPN